MKSAIEACLIGSVLFCGALAQDSPITLRAGVSVQMAVAGSAVEIRAADEPNATVVAITAAGKIYVGTKPVEPGELSSLTDEMVYVKADSRVPYQRVLSVLEALRGRSVVLLTAAPENAVRQGIVPPYGMRLIVSR